MSLNAKPVLSTIPAFDADFGTPGKENITAPILKFSWKDGVVKKNRVIIRDYDTGETVYDCTIETMALKHQLHNQLDTSEKVQVVTYSLKNGHKYVAQVYVYSIDNVESLASNSVIFYCFNTPIFRFTNFTRYIGEGNKIALVDSNSINLTVSYSQNDNELLSYYKFILQDYNGKKLLESEVKYSSLSDDTLRYTLGGMSETPEDKYGNIQLNQAYKIICKGETKHGIVVETEQRFVVKPISSGVGALVNAKNSKTGNITIYSNYKIMNANCSTDNPTYIYDEFGKPYAIDLSKGDYVEFIDGFIIKNPYEIIFSGKFKKGRIITLTNSDGIVGTVDLIEVTYTQVPYYYFCFSIEKDGIHYRIMTEYFRYNKSLINAVVDLSYYKGLYNIKAKINYDGNIIVVNSNDMGNVTVNINTDYTIQYENRNVVLNSDIIKIFENDGNVSIMENEH